MDFFSCWSQRMNKMALRSNWCIRNITSEEKRLGVDFKSTLRDHPEIPFLLNEGPLIWNPLLRTHFWGRRNHIMCWLKIILVAGLFSSSAFNLMTSLLSFLWQRKSKSDHQQLKKKNSSAWECGMFAWTITNGSPRISTPKGLRGKHYLEQVRAGGICWEASVVW